MIDGMLQDAEEHYQTLLQAAPKPHVLDHYTVGRVFEVFGRQKDDRWLFEEQFGRWKSDKLSVGQRDEVDRLTEQVARCRTVIESMLSLAQQLKQSTIEKVFPKSDLEFGWTSVKTILFQDVAFDKSTGETITRKLTITASDQYGLPIAPDDEILLGLLQLSRLQNPATEGARTRFGPAYQSTPAKLQHFANPYEA